MFEKVFEKIKEKNSSVKIIGIWGKDGLELEKKYFVDESDPDIDMTGAQIADIMMKLSNLKFVSEKSHFTLEGESSTLLIYTISPDYFLIVMCGKELIMGKLLFFLNLYKDDFEISL